MIERFTPPGSSEPEDAREVRETLERELAQVRQVLAVREEELEAEVRRAEAWRDIARARGRTVEELLRQGASLTPLPGPRRALLRLVPGRRRAKVG